jgi:serine/threonine protein kinase
MLSKIDKYDNLKLYHSSHEGELYTTDDKSIIIKVYYLDDPDFNSIIKIVDISMNVSKLIPEYVPEIYLKYETKDYIALVMERINGITLSEYLSSKRNDNISIIAKLVISLYEAALALHNSGYTHGDLHGNNIIIHNDHKIKLIDFGQSNLVNSMSASDENIPEIYGDYLYLKYHIAVLIFPKLEPSTIVVIIKTIKDFTVKDVMEYDQFPEIANSLFNILNTFPKAIEDDIDY